MAATGNSVFQASRARTDAKSKSSDKGSAKADAKFAGKAIATGGRSAASAAGDDAKLRASKGGAAAGPKNILPKRPSKLGQDTSKKAAKAKGGARGGKPGKLPSASGVLSKGNPRRLLVAEFLICFIVLGAAAIVAPQGEKSGVPRLMSKGTGLALLFLVLALASAGGAKATKAAVGLGALVTAGYLFTSPDAANILKWITQFYGANGGKLGAAADSGAATGTAAGTGLNAAQQGVNTIIGDILAGQPYNSGVAQGAGAGAGAGIDLTSLPGTSANKEGLL